VAQLARTPHGRPAGTRLLVVALVAGVLTSGSALPAGAAPALPAVTVSEDMVEAAQADAQAAREQVERVAGELTEGTERWEAGTAALGRARAAADEARLRADLAAQTAAVRRRTFTGFVASSYRSPFSSGSPVLLHGANGPDAVIDALRASADLEEVRGSQSDALIEAQAAGDAAVQADGEARRLQDAAAAQERQLALDLEALQSLAERTSAQLQSATGAADRLEEQRTEQLAARAAAQRAIEQERRRKAAAAAAAARKAAAEAAAEAERRAAAARDARERAEAEAARRAAARQVASAPPPAAALPPSAPVPRTGGGGGTGGARGSGGTGGGGGAGGGDCAGRSTDGYGNGTIPASALCPLTGAPGQQLRADAARAYDRLSAAARSSRGAELCITDSYRDYAGQVDVFRRKPGLAAVPGTSNHGWGVAVDLCGGVQTFGTSAYAWMKANGPRFGWVHPSWAEPGGSRPEAWHWEYVG